MKFDKVVGRKAFDVGWFWGMASCSRRVLEADDFGVP
jgi:hypothetical protein